MKSVVRLSDHLDMTIAVDWDVKPATKANKHTARVKLANRNVSFGRHQAELVESCYLMGLVTRKLVFGV